MNNTNTVAIVVIAIALVAGFSGLLFLDLPKSTPDSTESITVAYSPFESTALFWIAEDQHFFTKNGLNVTTRKYDSGQPHWTGW